MSGTLQGFVRCDNNSLVAIMTAEAYERYQAGDRDEIGPIFLFSPHPRPEREPWIVGDLDLMRQLTAEAVVVPGDFGVPFSNGWMLYESEEALVKEFSSLGSVGEAIELFKLEVPALSPA